MRGVGVRVSGSGFLIGIGMRVQGKIRMGYVVCGCCVNVCGGKWKLETSVDIGAGVICKK